MRCAVRNPPISWKQAFDETGSVETTIAAPLANTQTYQIAPSSYAAVTTATPPPEVQALIDQSLFVRQPIGAGYLSNPMP